MKTTGGHSCHFVAVDLGGHFPIILGMQIPHRSLQQQMSAPCPSDAVGISAKLFSLKVKTLGCKVGVMEDWKHGGG